MPKQILLPPAMLKELRATLKVSRVELWRALNFERNSDKAKRLRVAALAKGGLIYTGEPAPDGFIPDCKINFQGDVIRQEFDNGLSVVINKSTAVVYMKNKRIAEFRNMTTEKWSALLYNLQNIYNLLNS